MASGSSGRANSGSKGFDFGSDDILCSYEDYSNQDSSNGTTHSDPVVGSNSTKDFHKSRIARSSVFPANSYSQPEDSFCQDMIAIFEKSMKKHSDNIMRFLEGVSSRLSQLELYCYNLDKSIGEMRADLVRDHGEADAKLKSLAKHVQEVHRSVQILRDKQELAEAQKELAKLQLAQKESTSSSHSQTEEKSASPASDSKKADNTPEMHNQQLALALPNQVMPPQLPAPVPTPAPAPAPQAQPQNVTQQQSYYLPQTQLPNPPAQTQHPQSQYLPPDTQYRTHPQQAQTQLNPTPSGQQYPQYQQQPQQWAQQLPQQVQQPQQPAIQPQIRPSSPAVYPTYPPPGLPANSSPPETMPNSMPMQVSYAAVPQPLSSRADAIAYGYGAGRIVPQQPPPPQQIKATYGTQAGDGYATAGPHSALPPGSAYMMYDSSEGGRTHAPTQQPHFPQGGYPPGSLAVQNPQQAAGANMVPRSASHTHFVRNHPYNELMEKLVNMGFRGDHVMTVIQRMEESGQSVDFNSVLDRLSSQRGGWSG